MIILNLYQLKLTSMYTRFDVSRIFFILTYEIGFCTALPKAPPIYRQEVQQVRRREPLAQTYYIEEKESAPNFTFLLRPRVIQIHQTCKLLCCLSGTPIPTVCVNTEYSPQNM